MTRKTYTRLERIIIVLMVAGMIGMFQPLSAALFRYAFLLLLASTLAFIVVSHVVPRSDLPPSD
jgi:hypothetical protein